MTAQPAMAELLDVDPHEVHQRGWPDWLLLAFCDDRTVLESPWTPVGTVKVEPRRGTSVSSRWSHRDGPHL
ncbi:hypothetical protein ABZ260_42280 [Streptosporangium sp. NPDC006013]|uniref:hypothetical protein n=1 Tax=Streptosporangium sp. NPDC006013 TaxID=3155596 RepID=UPI0033A8C074